MNWKLSLRKSSAPLLALLLITTACAPRSSNTNAAPAANSLTYTGVVTVSGTEGSAMPSLNVSGRAPVILLGDLVSELRALSGARVAVFGTAATGTPGDAIDVASYIVEEINGQKPYVGILTRTYYGYGLREEPGQKRVIDFERMPASLNDKVGFKIWVTGVVNSEGGGLLVQAFGVIRETN